MRVKRGQTKSAKHKKVLKLAKGYRMSYSKLYRRAKEAVRHAGAYSFAHRRHRRAQIRNEWIKVISSALSEHFISYSKFFGILKSKNIIIDRKNLAELATFNIDQFRSIVNQVVSAE